MSGCKCIKCDKRDIAFDCEYYCLICYKKLWKKKRVLNVKE